MANSINDIQEQIIGSVKADPELSGKLTSKSKVAIYRLWAYVVSVAIHLLELFHDQHRSDMEELYQHHHAHTLNWYEEWGKEFIFGRKLIPFTRTFDTSGMADEEIAAAKIVTYSSCTRERRDDYRLYLRLKVVKGVEEWEPLTREELKSFQSYMHTIQDAGVDLVCESNPADRIRMKWVVYYDPQILDATGNRIDGKGDNIVRNAIHDYLKNLPFNGLYVPIYHVDFLQSVDGIRIPTIRSASLSTDGGESWADVQEDGVRPQGGWCKFYTEEDLEVELIPFKYGENVQD